MNFKIFKFLMFMGILLTFTVSTVKVQAALPEVIWAEELLLVSDDTNELLVTHNDADLKGYKQKIANALTRKLYAERDAGRLPFTLKENAETYEYEGLFTDVDSEVPVALIPLGIIADSLDAKYEVKGKSYHKSIVVGSVYLAICKGGSTSNNWTMIGGVPISGYTVLGDNLNHLLTSEPTKKEKADAYVRAMEKVIDRMSFDDFKNHLQNLNSKKIPNTYEVMEVDLSSKKAAEIFGNQQGKIQAMLGAFYSAKFQENNKAVVYPPIAMIGKNTGGDMSSVGNKSAADDVSDTLYSLTGGKSTSGATMTLSMPTPDHKINLDFNGAGWQELQGKKASDVVKNMGYLARLKMTLDKTSEKVVEDTKTVQYLKTDKFEQFQSEQLPDIYTELLIRLADKLATGKK